MKTCALCGFRDATHSVAIDDRAYVACDKCDAPAQGARPREAMKVLRSRVQRLLRSEPGMSLTDVVEALGYDPGDENLKQRVRRAWREFHRIVTTSSGQIPTTCG